jgi:hypothetical protein
MAQIKQIGLQKGVPVTVHAGRGYLGCLALSHSESSPQTVIVYDNTTAAGTVLMQLIVNPSLAPSVVQFNEKLMPQYSTGLAIDPANCSGLVLAIGLTP